MNKNLWSLRKSFKQFLRKANKRIQSVFFNVSIENLKNAPYESLPSPVDWQKIANGREIIVEVGSGHGEVLLANNRLNSISIGYEIKSRFFRLTQRKTRKRDDIFIFKGSGYESLFLHYKNYCIDKVFILFPDPWHKKKHAKRRPLTANLFTQLTQKLKPNGEIVIATDWTEYADFIKQEAMKVTSLYSVDVKAYVPTDFGLPITHFHQKWVRKGRKFTAIVLKKLA